MFYIEYIGKIMSDIFFVKISLPDIKFVVSNNLTYIKIISKFVRVNGTITKTKINNNKIDACGCPYC